MQQQTENMPFIDLQNMHVKVINYRAYQKLKESGKVYFKPKKELKNIVSTLNEDKMNKGYL